MSYSKSFLLYEDEPVYDLFLKLIIVLVPVGLLAASFSLWSSGEPSGSLALLAETLLISLIFWIVFPRRYQIYEDHLRIVLGGPFTVKIGFERIRSVEVTSRTFLTVNFTTRVRNTYVRIVKKNGLSIAITPKSNDPFVDNANRAMSQWARMRGKTLHNLPSHS